MKTASHPVLRSLTVVALFLPVLTLQAFADKAEDWETLARLHETYLPYQSQYSANQLDGAYVEQWKQWRREFEPFAKTFKSRYGTTDEALRTQFLSESLPEGVQVYPHQLVDLLNLDLVNYQNTIAGWLKQKGDESYKQWEQLTDPADTKLELKVDYAQRAIRSYRLAKVLNPDAAASELKKAEAAHASTEKQWKVVLEQLDWPGHHPDFAGPGDPDVLAAEALKLLNTMRAEGRNWSKPEYDDEHIPVAACVVGKGWEVHKTVPVTGEPTQYTLHLFVLFRGNQSDEIGYAYHMQFYTREEAGVKKAPPFLYCNSRSYEKHKMLLSKAPSAKGASSTGLWGWIWRLALSTALLTAGLAASRHPSIENFKPLQTVLPTLRNNLPLLARTVLILGLLSFLGSLLTLSPFAHLLPQAVAMALGLALCTPASPSERKPSPPSAVLERTLTRLEPAHRALVPVAPVLALAAIAFGLLHLLLGGIALL